MKGGMALQTTDQKQTARGTGILLHQTSRDVWIKEGGPSTNKRMGDTTDTDLMGCAFRLFRLMCIHPTRRETVWTTTLRRLVLPIYQTLYMDWAISLRSPQR